MCAVFQVRMVDPAPGVDLEDAAMVFARRGFLPDDGREGRREIWLAVGRLALDGGEEACLCALEGDAARLAALAEALRELAGMCRQLWYARDVYVFDDLPGGPKGAVEVVAPDAVRTTHRPGGVGPWCLVAPGGKGGENC